MTSAIGLRDQRVRTYAKSDQGTDGVVRPVFTFANEYWGRIDESAAAVRFAQEKLQLKVDALAEFSDDVAIPVNGFLLDTLTGLHWWVRKIYNVRALHRLWVGLEAISEELVATFTIYEGASTLDGVHVIDPGTPPTQLTGWLTSEAGDMITSEAGVTLTTEG